jgi:uncharacterized membrane protein YqjE
VVEHSGEIDLMRVSGTDDRPVTAVLSALVDNIQDLVRTEARLATTELSEEVGKAARPLGSIVLGVALAFYGVGFFLVTAVILLSQVLQMWAATALVGALVSSVALGLLIAGRRGWKLVRLAPEKTKQSLKENLAWNPTVNNSLHTSRQRATS